VLALGKTYGPARLEAACARALAHDSPYYRTVKTILSTGADCDPDERAAEPPRPTRRARFARAAAENCLPPPAARPAALTPPKEITMNPIPELSRS
jgi:hypothetical protein